MAASRTLKLNILAETKDLISGLNKADKATSSAGDKIKKGFKIAAAAIAAAGAAAFAFGVKAIAAGEAAATANARIGQINESMGLFGSSVGEVNDRLIQYAEATARATGIDQNSIKATQAKLLTFKDLAQSANQVGGEFDRATKAAIDLAAAGFGSAETNAAQLGKALQDPIKGLTALSRSGVTFTETEKERIKTLVESNQVGEAQRLVLEAIEKQVGGTAEATANASERIKVTFNLLTEQVGMVLLPVFERFANFLIDQVVPFIERYLVPAVQKLTDSFNKNATPAIENMRKIVADFVLPALKNLWEFITRFIVPTLRNILEPVLGLVQRAFEFLSAKVRENREGLDVFIAIARRLAEFVRDVVAPILGGILATAFNLVVRAVGLAIDNFAKVFEIIGKVARFLGFDFSLEVSKATKTVNNLNTGTVNAYKSFAEQSRTINTSVIPSLKGATSATNALTTATNGAASATKGLSSLQRELNALRAGGAIPSAISPDQNAFFRSELSLIRDFGGFIEGINLLPTDPFYGFGKGGNVGAAISQRQGGSATATGTVNINVSGTVIDPEGAARALQQIIDESNARGGPLIPIFGGP
jgi:hypothetical protein